METEHGVENIIYSTSQTFSSQVQLGLPYLLMFMSQSLDLAVLTVLGMQRLLSNMFHAIQETVFAALAWIAEADRIAAELKHLGIPCGWVFECLVDERFHGLLEHMALVFDHIQLNWLLVGLIGCIVPQPLYNQTTIALVADQVHREMLAAIGPGPIAIHP